MLRRDPEYGYAPNSEPDCDSDLVVGGSDDPASAPDHAELLARSIPGAVLRMLPTAHLSNIEQPMIFGEFLLTHLGSGCARTNI